MVTTETSDLYQKDTFYLLYPLKKSIDTLLLEPTGTLFTKEYPSICVMLDRLEKCFTTNYISDVNNDTLWSTLDILLTTSNEFVMYKNNSIYDNNISVGKLRGLFAFLFNSHLFEEFVQKLFLNTIMAPLYTKDSLWNNEEQRYLFMDMIRVLSKLQFSFPIYDKNYNSTISLQPIQTLNTSSNKAIKSTSALFSSVSLLFSSINNSLFYFDNCVNSLLTSKQEANSFEQPLFDPQSTDSAYLQRVSNEPQTCIPPIIIYALSWLIDNSNYQNIFYINNDISCVYVLRTYYAQNGSFPDYTDSGSVWSLLVSYFGHISDCLFTDSKSYAFLSCQYIFNTKLRVKAICNLLRDLPLPHKYLMEKFFNTLSQLYYSLCHSPEEYIYRKRVSEVFGTILLRRDHNISFMGSEREAAIDLIDFMLINSNDIFLGIQKELEILEVLLTNKKRSLIHINQTLNEAVSPENPNHILLLKRLWYKLVGRKLEIEGKDPVVFSPVSNLWKDVGFQREIPWTDFRGGGTYSLENLVYFVENYPNIIDDVLSFDEVHFFPIAIVGVNITNLLSHLLHLDVSIQEYSPMNHVHTPVWSLANSPGMFNKFYCMCMILVLTQYKLSQSTFLTINPILSIIQSDLQKILDKNPINMTSLSIYLEDLRQHYIQLAIPKSTKKNNKAITPHSNENLKQNPNPNILEDYNLDLYIILNHSTREGLNQSSSMYSSSSDLNSSEDIYQQYGKITQNMATRNLLITSPSSPSSSNSYYEQNHNQKDHLSEDTLTSNSQEFNKNVILNLPSLGNAKHHINANIVNIDPSESITDITIENYIASNIIIPEKYSKEQFIFLPSYFKLLQKHIPLRFQGNSLKLIYKLQVDGASCATLIEKSRGMNTGILIIKDAGNGVFGGYLTESLKYTQRYYGSGESFVFSFMNPLQLKIYHWSKLNHYFIHSDETHIGMGGGGSFAFYIDSDLNDGYSGDCKTYNSECLATTGDFQCYDIELWTFINPIEMYDS